LIEPLTWCAQHVRGSIKLVQIRYLEISTRQTNCRTLAAPLRRHLQLCDLHSEDVVLVLQLVEIRMHHA